VTSHIDQEPDWADGRRYARIVGVPLTRSYPDNGGLIVWPFEGPEQETVDLAPGDMLVMHPRLPHSSGFNRQGGIRYAVYFRFLEDAARAC
jgi:ectoine hydroxylase-related dioxygenase (phytanoyl-CoA dioxygenase family)